MKIKVLLSIFIQSVSLLVAQESWSSTSFEYYWNQAFNRLQFREPQTFTPVEIKVGQFSYGGNNYWSQSFFNMDLNSEVAVLDSTESIFDIINSSINRQILFIEIDFLKLNISNYLYYQNFLDIQIGLGFRNINNLYAISLPNHWIKVLPDNESLGEYKFKPNINNLNYNITASYQFSHYLISYLYYNFGYSFGSLYESTGGKKYLNAKGISEGLSLGLKYMVNPKGMAFSFTYGIDFRLQRTTLFEIDDPREISHINQLNLYSKGIFFSLSTTFGGKASSGDIAYRQMLKEDYINASYGFEKYISDFPNSNKIDLAEKMLQFCDSQTPYQLFDSALFYFNKKELNSAMQFFELASENADSILLSNINLHRQELAITLINGASQKDIFSKLESLYLDAYRLAPDYFYVKEQFSNFYIEKGDKLLDNQNYELAYGYYNKALEIFPNHKEIIISKYPKLINGFNNDVQLAIDKEDYVLAKYCIEKIIEIDPRYKLNMSEILVTINNNLENYEQKKINNKMRDFVLNRSEKRKEEMGHNLVLGMNKDEVLELYNEPDVKDKILRGDIIFEMWTYNNGSNIKRLIFENNFLIKVEK